MSRRTYQTSIPADATEVVEEWHPNGAKAYACYFLGGERVGCRQWDEDGGLMYDCGMRAGVRHGNVYCFYANGQMEEVQPYRNGQMHGTGKQWSEEGELLITWQLTNSTGVDLWCDSRTGTLAEEHFWPGPEDLGKARQWNNDEKTVWQEYFYGLDKGYHGVWREWNARGRLRRGFPRYYVNDRKVTRRQYLRACAGDPTLPPYRPEEDDPHRQLPAEYLRQRKKRR
jgi:antitoxin component YwqK of YwqJK toxin-antitoxin module